MKKIAQGTIAISCALAMGMGAFSLAGCSSQTDSSASDNAGTGRQAEREVSQTVNPMMTASPMVQTNRPSDTGPRAPRPKPPGFGLSSRVFR